MAIKNRITEMLGVEYPIVQAPMAWISRAQLAAAVSNAGGMGIIETSSGQLDVIKGEIAKMRNLTDKPFGVNIALAYVRDPGIVQFVVDQGIRFVTTSAGDPTKFTAQLKAAGLTVFHVVPTLKAAMKAIKAGVDGLVVEGAEGGGFKNPQPVMSMVLLPLIAEKVGVPIIAAGGFSCGRSMAAAFALGAEGIQMGTRMVCSQESPVHANWKQAIVNAAETDTIFLNQFSKPVVRVLRTEKTSRLERELVPDYAGPPLMAEFGNMLDLYQNGDMEASIALCGQVAGRIDSVKTVAEIIAETMREFEEAVRDMAGKYG